MDEVLLALVEAVENGQPAPRLRISTQTMLVTGQPVPTWRFSELNEDALAADFVAYKRDEERSLPRKQRRDLAAVEGDAQQATARNMASIKATDRTGGAICVEQATCWPWAGGDGIRLPAARIPLASVDVWWVTGGELLKAPAQGGSWFVGGLFPIGN